MQAAKQFKLKKSSVVVMGAVALIAAARMAQAGAGWADNTDKAGMPFKQPTFYANSPMGTLAAHGPAGSSAPEGTTRDTGTALRKFVDTLPLLDGYVSNQGLVNANAPTAPGRHIPTAIKEDLTSSAGQALLKTTPAAHSLSFPDADFYEIAVVEYREQLHSDLPAVTAATTQPAGAQTPTTYTAGQLASGTATPLGQATVNVGGTTLRGYVQIATPNLPAATPVTQLFYLNGKPVLDNKGKPVFIVGDKPHYLGPVINSTSGVPVRLRFDNYLPTGHYDPITKTRGGDVFIPTDLTMPGSGLGPKGAVDPNAPQPFERYTQNRTNIHLHGGDTPWISDGQPHDWITPAGENTLYPVGETTQNVPDMPDYGAGTQTYYYPNNQSSRMEWYHDHSYGSTRIDVYAGIVSAFLIHDATEAALKTPNGSVLGNDGVTTYNFQGALAGLDEVPLIFEDKTFVPKDVAVEDSKWNVDSHGNPVSAWGQYGDLWFPHVYEANQNPNSIDGTNPAGRWDYGPWFWPVFPAPLALPSGEYGNVSATQEQFSDTPLINGIAYPNFNVEPKAYRFRLLNASLQRYLNLGLYVAESVTVGITNGGQGYNQGTTVTFTGGGAATQATGHVVVDTVTGQIAAIVTDAQGSGYTSVPTVTITNGTGAAPSGVDPATGAPYALVAAQTYATINTEVPMVDAVMPAANAAYAFNTYDGRPGGIPNPAAIGPNIIQIGTEGGFLAQPNVIASTPISYQQLRRIVTVLNVLDHGLYVGPAERADFVIDFSQFAGRTLILYNDCPAPNPGFDARVDYFTGDGDQTSSGGADNTMPGFGPNTRTIMRINVAATQFNGNAPAAPFDPAGNGGPLATDLPKAFAASQDVPIVPESWQNTAYGTNYTDNVAHIYAGSYQQPTFTFNNGGVAQAIQGFRMDSAGAGYSVAPQVVLTGGYGAGGTPATAHAVLDVAGKRVSSIVLDTPGSGYTNAPIVSLSGGDGIGASATAITDQTQSVFVQPKGIQELFEPNYGRMNATFSVELPFTSVLTQTTIPVGYIDPPTDQIADGETQFWKVTHNGVDTHVVHFHLFNVQVVNRVAWDGTIVALDPAEFGWKETVKMNPLEDIYVAVRPKTPKQPFGVPQSIRALDPTQPIGASAGFSQVDPKTGLATTVTNQLYNFDWEYVWHCHILGHEENDFMRPVMFNFGTLPPASVSNVSYNPATQTVSWTDPTPVGVATTYVDKSNEQGFLVQRSEDGGKTWPALPATTPQTAAQATMNPAGFVPNVTAANATSWVDPQPAGAGTVYRVLGFNSAGYSSSYLSTVPGTGAVGTTGGIVSNANGTPNAPTQLRSAVGAYNPLTGGYPITLSWVSSLAPAKGFVITRQGGFTANGTAIPNLTFTVPAGTYSYTDSLASEVSMYTYTVQADNGTGTLSPGSIAQVATPYAVPPVVSNVTNKVDPSGNNVAIQWAMPVATTPDVTNVPASPHVTAFNVVRKDAAGNLTTFGVQQVINPLSGTITLPETSYVDVQPVAGTSTYTIYAVNGDKTGTALAPNNGSTTTVTLSTAVVAPGLQGLSATANGPTQVTLNWAPPPTGSVVTGAIVMRALASAPTAFSTVTANTGSTAASYVDTTAAQNTAYVYQVQWLNGNNQGTAQTATVTTPFAAAVPVATLTASVVASATTAGTFVNTLSWTPGAATSSYTVSRCLATAANANCTGASTVFTTVSQGVTGTSFSDTVTAASGMTFVYQVQAVNGSSVATGVKVSVYDIAPPLPATNPANQISSGSILVSWTASLASPNTAAATNYLLERSADNGVTWSSLTTVAATQTSYADTTPVLGTTYLYRITSQAVMPGYATVSSQPSATTTAVYKLQNAPVIGSRSFGGTAAAPTVTVNFTETPVAGAPAVSSFAIYRDNVAYATAAAAGSYTDPAPGVGATHTYTVYATNVLGNSAASATVTAATVAQNAPTQAGTTVNFSQTTTTVRWTETANANAPAVSGFQVYAYVDGSATATLMTTTPATLGSTATSAQVATTPGNTYVFVVRANNLFGQSADSNSYTEIDGTPAAPASFTNAISSGAVTLNWPASSSGSTTSYVLTRSVNGAAYAPLTSVAVVAGQASYSFADATVAVGNTYAYQIVAQAAATGATTQSSQTTTTTAVYKVQNAPTATTTPVFGGTAAAPTVRVNFNPAQAVNGAPAVTGFAVYRDGVSIATLAVNATSYTDNLPGVGTTHSYVIYATNAVGNSAASATVTAATVTQTAPVQGADTVTSGTSTTVRWTETANASAPAVSSFQVYAYVDGSTTATLMQTGQQNQANGNYSTSVTTATGANYVFVVRANNLIGQSGDSNQVTVQNGQPAPTLGTVSRNSALGVPTNTDTVSLSWTPVMPTLNGVTVTQYQVQYANNANFNGATTTTVQAAAAGTALQTTTFNNVARGTGATPTGTAYFRVLAVAGGTTATGATLTVAATSLK